MRSPCSSRTPRRMLPTTWKGRRRGASGVGELTDRLTQGKMSAVSPGGFQVGVPGIGRDRMYSSSGPEACPNLGRQADPETYYAYPTSQNRCHAGASPAEVSLLYQDSTCLGGEWRTCRFYHGESQPPAAAAVSPSPDTKQGPEPQTYPPQPPPASRFRGSRRRAVMLLAAAGVLLALGLYFVLRTLTGAPPSSSPPVVHSPATSVAALRLAVSPTTPSPIALATTSPPAGTASIVEPTATTTPTHSPSRTPTSSPTPTDSPTPSPTLTATPTQTRSPSRTPTATPSTTVTPTPEVTASPTPAPTVVTSPWNVVHVVQSGETLSAVALRYRTTPRDVASANGIENLNLIYTGQVLTIPVLSPQDALKATPVLTGTVEALTTTEPITLPVPTLVAPAEGVLQSGAVQLRWDWPLELDTGQYFAVHVWWEDQQTPTYLSFTSDPILTLNLGTRVPGVYRWSVRLADVGQLGEIQILRRFLSAAGERASFTWSGPEP